MTPALLREWLASGVLKLPLPGSGETARRFHRLAALAEIDIVAGRLAEAHADAVAILAELNGPDAQADQLWGVWAAEARDAALCARGDGERLVARRHQGVVFGRRTVHARAGHRTVGVRRSAACSPSN